jgi:hypothetical protein
MTGVDAFNEIIRDQLKLLPPALTDGVYADLADAIIAAHNAEGRDFTTESFLRATARLNIAQRYAVAMELPEWAARKINVWEDAA